MTVRPETLNDPTVEMVEELADVSLAVMQTPTANDRVDLSDELLCFDRSFSPCTPTNLILEVLDRFLTRDRIECALTHSTASFLRRKLQGTCPPLDLIPEKLETVTNDLAQYLAEDPITSTIYPKARVQPILETEMAEYVTRMVKVSRMLHEWLKTQPSGVNLLNLADNMQIEMQFSLISSLGKNTNQNNELTQRLTPFRILDPLFWAFEYDFR